MHDDDRVLVGVINRLRDFEAARDEGWYRVPVGRAPRAFDSEVVAFYLSRAFGPQNGGIHFYARRHGHELVRRRDVLPDEADHPRAEQWYYLLQLGPLVPRTPPILNPARRPIAFILTTWDRFCAARTIADLYSRDGYYVVRHDT